MSGDEVSQTIGNENVLHRHPNHYKSLLEERSGALYFDLLDQNARLTNAYPDVAIWFSFAIERKRWPAIGLDKLGLITKAPFLRVALPLS